jgi:hypothetical protein
MALFAPHSAERLFLAIREPTLEGRSRDALDAANLNYGHFAVRDQVVRGAGADAQADSELGDGEEWSGLRLHASKSLDLRIASQLFLLH